MTLPPRHPRASAEELLGHAGFLRRLAAGLVKDPEAAADLVQETYRAALEHPPRDTGSLRGWLATVARNLARNAKRGDRRREAREHDRARVEAQAPEELAEERIEVQRQLFAEVLALKPEARTVLYLRYYEGLTPTAIAARLGLPLKTVKTRHTRALAALRERLDARGRREEWMAALLPLAIPRGAGLPGGASAGTAVLGGLVVKKVVAASVVLLGVWFAWSVVREDGERTHAVATPETLPLTQLEPAATLAPPPLLDLSPLDSEGIRSERRPGAPERPADQTRGTLEVVLRWPEGAPAADVGLLARCDNDPAPREERFRVRTNPEGRARFEDLFAGPVVLDLFRGQRFRTEVAAGETRTVELTVADAFTVAGTVVDPRGEPVAGAEIWGQGRHRSWPNAERLARTDSTGRFHVRGFAGNGVLGARAAGHLPSVTLEVRSMPVDERGHKTATLELGEAGGRVSGHVLDPDGRPVAGASVHAGPRGGGMVQLPDGRWALEPGPAPARTDAQGAFLLHGDVSAGTHEVTVVARGYPAWQGEVVVVDGTTTSLDVRLEHPASIAGRVVDAGGRPVAGARVLAAKESPGGHYFHRFPPSEARSDEDGRFTVTWLAPGERELNASVPDRPQLGKARGVVACEAGTTSACELVLDPGRRIAGRVVDAHGQPLAGWRVRGHVDPRRGTNRPVVSTTDAEGAFELANLAEGACLLVVGDPEGRYDRASLDGVAPNTLDVLLVVEDADAADGGFFGHLRDADGRVPGDVQLVLQPAGGEFGEFVDFDLTSGTFEGRAHPGAYSLLVLRGASTVGHGRRFEVREGAEVDVGEIVIGLPGRLVLSIPALTAKELASLTFLLERPYATSESLRLEDGRLVSTDLEPGTWFVSVLENELFLRGNAVEVRPGEVDEVELSIERGIPVRFRITAAPPRRVFLTALEPDGTPISRCPSGVSDDGVARMSLPMGPARVTLNTESGRSATVELDVRPESYGMSPIEVELR